MVAELQRRKTRWCDVMNGKSSPRHLLMVRYSGDMDDVLPYRFPTPDALKHRIERSWQIYNVQMQRLDWLKDDMLPHLDCIGGTEIFAEAFGCRVHYPDDNMPFALPMVYTAEEARRVKVPCLDVPALARAFEMADELVRRAGRGALVRPVDIQSPMDIAALIWEKSSFMMAMIETPDAVKELAEKCCTLLMTFLDEWHRRYGDEHIAHFPEYYMPGGITLSEDEIGIVNNDMFEEFFLPHLVKLSNHFGAIGIHCCADSRHQWASFRKIPNLKFLNLKRELYAKAYPFFSGGHLIQQHFQTTPAEWDEVMSRWPDARLYIDVSATTRDEALRLVERYYCEG